TSPFACPRQPARHVPSGPSASASPSPSPVRARVNRGLTCVVDSSGGFEPEPEQRDRRASHAAEERAHASPDRHQRGHDAGTPPGNPSLGVDGRGHSPYHRAPAMPTEPNPYAPPAEPGAAPLDEPPAGAPLHLFTLVQPGKATWTLFIYPD